MKEYIEKSEAIEALTGWDTDPTDEEIEFTIHKIPAADVVERKRGRCKFCGGKDNAFHIINAETATYSGIELAMNRQGMLRVRVYDDYECETALPRSSEIIMIANCPNCGADMREVDHAETD